MHPSRLRQLGLLLGSLLLASSAVVAPATSHPVMAASAGPVAEWTFDDGSGSTAKDAIGSLDGTLSGGATWVTSGAAQGSGAIAFDGVNGAVTIADAPALHPPGAFSVATWFNYTVVAPYAGYTPMIAKGDLGCSRGASWEIGNAGGLRGGVALTTYPGTQFTSSQFGASDGKWHLGVYTVDPASQRSTMTVDGHTTSTAWPGPDTILYGGDTLVDSALRFGATSSCSWRFPFTGRLDDVRIWDRVLSQDEILAMTPGQPTTTTLTIQPTYGSNGTVAYVDTALTLSVTVTPWPEQIGEVTIYASKDGGPEAVFGTITIDPAVVRGSGSFIVPAGALDPASYTFRASWAGASIWLASESAPHPLTMSKRTVTMQASASPNNITPGASSTITAKLAVSPVGASAVVNGSIDFYETTNGADVFLASAPLGWAGDPSSNQATLQLSSVAAGTHTYEARWGGSPVLEPGSAQTQVVAGPQASGVSVSFPQNPILNTQAGIAQVVLGTSSKDPSVSTLPAPSGTLTLTDQDTGAVIGQVPVTATGAYDFTLPKYPVGTKTFVAAYSGDSNFDPATSSPATLTIAADIVDATGVDVQYSTFYPYRDGYRDTDAIRGMRNETASVAIKVLSPLGKVVKTGSIGAGVGPYSLTWNGRNSSGTMLASGTYKVVQVLADAAGIRKTVTTAVVLSSKRLYYTTVSYTKRAKDQYAKRTTAWLAWAFTLPSATVYKNLKFSVEGKTKVPPAKFGPQDFTQCGVTVWSPGCVTRFKYLPYTVAWVSVTGSPTRDRAGRTVRLYAWLDNYLGGSATLYYGKVAVTYGVLK